MVLDRSDQLMACKDEDKTCSCMSLTGTWCRGSVAVFYACSEAASWLVNLVV